MNERRERNYLKLVYLATALVPSATACLANSLESKNQTAVWVSRLIMVDLLLYCDKREASAEILPKMSFTKESMTLMALLEIPVSG